MSGTPIVCRFTHGGQRYAFPGVIVPTKLAHDRIHVSLRCVEDRQWGTLHANPQGRWYYWAAPGEVEYVDTGPMSIDDMRVWG